MHIRKTAAVVLALVVVMSFAAPAFASVGYADNSTPTASNPAPATTTEVTAKTTEALSKAVASGGKAVIALVNVSTVPASAIQSVFSQATRAGVTNATVQVDAKEGNVVLSRVYIDAATAAKLSGTVNFSVATKGAEVTKAVNLFTKFFNNNISAVSLGQKGAFGANIKMAVKVDLSKLNTANLVFYAFDKATGKYTSIPAEYKIDSKGYLHFVTPVGGDIIISDKALARK